MKNFFRETTGKEAGFTLVELLIATVIMALVISTIFINYRSQKRAQVVQSQVADMQQSIRAAMLLITRAIREAGSDPQFDSDARFVEATTGRIRITRDIAGHPVNPNQGDGDTDELLEDVTFGFDPADDTDADPDGIPDAAPNGVASLCMSDAAAGGAFMPIAENIERVEFVYLDSDGVPIATPIAAGSGLSSISSVQVSILVRASERDPDTRFLNTLAYTSAGGADWESNDGFRRRLAIATVKCRNRR